MPARPVPSEWPALPYSEWEETRRTIHLYSQILGKIRLALSPPRPGWLGTPLNLTTRGLTTGPMPWGTAAIEILLNFVDHRLVILATDGWIRQIPLSPARCVADVYAEIMRALTDFGAPVDIWTRPQEVADLTPLDENRHDCTYDPASVRTFFKVLTATNAVFDEWQSDFFGKSSLQFWWGAFDLSTARFTGKRLEPPADAGYIMRWDLDTEHYSAGWWPGDERFPEPAFYAYAHPMPTGVESTPDIPGATWNADLGEWILRYEDARATGDVRSAVLGFLEGTWRAVGTASGWDLDAFRYEPPPPSPARGEGSS